MLEQPQRSGAAGDRTAIAPGRLSQWVGCKEI